MKRMLLIVALLTACGGAPTENPCGGCAGGQWCCYNPFGQDSICESQAAAFLSMDAGIGSCQ